MIHSYEKELIVAYFEGGNAVEKLATQLKELLDVIKQATAESKAERPQGGVIYPDND